MADLVRPLPRATTRQLVAWVLRRFRRYSVAGDSMLPTLSPDQVVLAAPVRDSDGLAIGDVVVAEHPRRPGLLIVKRIAAFDSAGWVHLASDNAAAVGAEDSRSFGPVGPESVVAVVVSAVGSDVNA